MALSMLAGGAECGPSNPLQGLSKRFDQDRGLQQDHFGAGRAGSSRETFRTATNSTPDQDAARFFSPDFARAQFAPDTAYDVSALRAALPPQMQMPSHVPQMQQSSSLATWASDFALQQPLHTPQSNASRDKEIVSPHDAVVSNGHIQQSAHPGVLQKMSWDKEFSTQEQALGLALTISQQTQFKEESSRQVPPDTDELARTAGLLLDNVRHEQNPKFQNSQFMDLMRKLRDRDVIVEGNQVVQNEGQQAAVDVKRKGRASDSTPLACTTASPHTSFADHARQELAQSSGRYQQYWNEAQTANTSRAHMTNTEVSSWDRLQSDWDQFEATTAGIKHVDNYQFQDSNPYLLGDSSMTHQHLMHSSHQSLSESVLQLEAAVQRDMNNAAAWFELGVKQQENEREHKALQALKRAVELDPSHMPTWLALAVSNTNEGNRVATYDAVNEWVNLNVRYQDATASLSERYGYLTETLILMARSDTSGVVDAEIQIALAILLNTDEDYSKAQDCFLAALAVRPEDWLLYNRVGATMANSGHAEDALQYYYKALELNPGYIRARFNLGISCINLRVAMKKPHSTFLTALVLQDNDGIRDSAGLNEKRGVTSTALWDSLKTTCLHMQRVDLATLCDRQDLEGWSSLT
ncbi:hypothetical protein FPV67DRAFT_1561383 [Lyophyllum atratum]|nr:hypothetical protein FPV67DRAFT_1561383 [Lyophyllum atratum]